MFDGLYTEEVKRCIYTTKALLPDDFPLMTDDREAFIVISIPMKHFYWRQIEGKHGRLEIALELEKLRTAIERTGIGCLIEKEWTE